VFAEHRRRLVYVPLLLLGMLMRTLLRRPVAFYFVLAVGLFAVQRAI